MFRLSKNSSGPRSSRHASNKDRFFGMTIGDQARFGCAHRSCEARSDRGQCRFASANGSSTPTRPSHAGTARRLSRWPKWAISKQKTLTGKGHKGSTIWTLYRFSQYRGCLVAAVLSPFLQALHAHKLLAFDDLSVWQPYVGPRGGKGWRGTCYGTSRSYFSMSSRNSSCTSVGACSWIIISRSYGSLAT